MNPEGIKDWAQASTTVLASIRAAIGLLSFVHFADHDALYEQT